MLRNLLLTIGIILTTSLLVYSQSSGTLKGKVIDKNTNEPLPFVNIVVELGGTQIGGASSDFDGNYIIKPITPGKYDVKATSVGYKPLLIRGIVISANQIHFYDIKMESTALTLETFEVIDYKVPLINKDQTSSGATVTAEEIKKMPNRTIDGIAATIGGVFSRDGERGNVRGARSNATVYYIDGIKVRGSTALPQSAIEQQTVILGGIPAQYGDATGGIIEVTTRGPSRKFGAGVEIETSQFLDAYGYNRVGLNLTGPLFFKKDEQGNRTTSLLGYFIACDFIHRKDGRPSTNKNGIYKASDDYLSWLEQNPLRPSGLEGGGTLLNGEYTRTSDLEKIKYTQNTSRYNVNVNGKIDIRTTETINLTLGGTFVYNQGRNISYNSSLFNYDKNGMYTNYTWRVFGRFTQRFPSDKESKSLVKNVYYSIQADWTKNHGCNQDADHKDDLFKYGYIGVYTSHLTKNYTLGSDTINGQYFNNVYIMDNYYDTLFTFDRREYNPLIANITDQYYSLYPGADNHRNRTQVQLLGAKLNGQSPDRIYGMWQSPGAVISGYNVYDNDQLGINASGAMDIGNHELKFGIQYEQRTDRGYAYGPIGLWTHMNGLTNFHIIELDLDDPTPVYRDGVFMDTIEYHRLYDGNTQTAFDINLRKKLGLPVNGLDYILIDSYDYNNNSITYFDENNKSHTITMNSELFDISMFSADDLLNDGFFYTYYRGFDYTGKKQKGKPTFEDFWFNKDENGNYTREIAAYEPIYMAGYIQDKFAFKDLIFNLGIRVDRFDANQTVLKDPYLFYEAYTRGSPQAEELAKKMSGYTIPSTIGNNDVVYIDNIKNPTAIVGYRDEDTWYNAFGTEIADPNALDVGSGVSPYIINPDADRTEIGAFQDYEPQVNVMPRISFSFPISDVALFFAHYDVLTQRPTSNNWSDPRIYYFFNNIGGVINNPNLKPSKRIDYELGFQQKLSNTSSLKFVVFYGEIRDMIQIYRFNGAYPKDYTSYNNIDFGTVKGMTIQYDLRRTNNARVSAYYTLQFADGTGSTVNTAAALVAAGLPNLRTIYPLAWDRRHQFNLYFDFRFTKGKEYNGPVIKREKSGKAPVQLLNNTGLSLTLNGGSGTPYTRSRNIYSQISGGTRLLKGTLEGSRLPWQFRIDARLDKDIALNMGKEGNKKKAYLTIYFQINNILNTKNVMGVYPATGNPSDDGYLAAAEWQREINEKLDPESFRDLYATFIDNPYNYSRPRTIHLGAIFNF
ncbi:MAG: carboxypeptidase-like regulatory domain-containing protein [Bacteroidetes bacterium]|nr:carboxypeptidase-like regulatory domain-containing protein [Bacteroidota bacterium]